MTTKSAGSVCSGYGGLDMALRLALGDLDETWFCEIEEGPSQVLAERFPGVKNYEDMTAVDWFKVERPDILTAGFPCQGNSAAGRRLGRLDPRWLWPSVEQAANILRPDEIFAENVANLLRVDKGEAFGDILADLHALGYDVRWVVLGACAAGLCHHRHRVFILATLRRKPRPRRRLDFLAEHVPALGSWWTPSGPQYGMKWPTAGSMVDGRVYAETPVPCGAPPQRPPALLPTPTAGNFNDAEDIENWKARRAAAAERHGNNGFGVPLNMAVRLLPTPVASEWKGTRSSPDARAARIANGQDTGGLDLSTVAKLLPTPRATDGAKGGPNQRGSKGDLALPAAVIGERFADYAAAVMRHITTTDVFPPEPTEPNRNGDARLAPAFPEWMMTLPAGWVTDILDRVPALKAIGNGVVPLQGALAYRLLAGLSATVQAAA